MSKIDKEAVKSKVVAMVSDLKGLVAVYANHSQEVGRIEGNTAWLREYRDSMIKQVNERTAASAKTKFENLQKNFEDLADALRKNDDTYDFSDPEFASCITLMNASTKPLPPETILGIVDKFLGNRQALLALAEVAKGSNEQTIREHIFNSETEIDALQEKLISLEVGFPGNIVTLPMFRDSVLKIAKSYGLELSDQEKDLGAGYQDIVTMQMRTAMGL